MPRVSGWETLPAEHQLWLLSRWKETGYGQNELIAQELDARLAVGDAGIASPDASTLYRWGRKLKAERAKIRLTAQLRAETIAALPDPSPDLADRVGAYFEGLLVEAFDDIDALPDIDPIARIDALTKASQASTARRRVGTQQAQADLARAKWDAEQAIRQEERTKAADQAETAARGQGVSPDGIAALRAAIMGAL